MSARELEAFLARIYADASARAAFKANPRGEASRAGLSEHECASLVTVDWVALELAAGSYAKKRLAKVRRNHARSFRLRLWNLLAALSKTVRSIL